MNIRILAIASLLAVSVMANCQNAPDINKTDEKGMKQGHWIKKYPNGNIQYEGTFTDNHPVGEFKRYNEDKTLKSVLIYGRDGKEADATIYHQNGFVASQGKYIDQLKEGKWKFYSYYLKDWLICEEVYTKNLKNGPSVKYYPNSKIAERINYVNDSKDGEWLQYHENGSQLLQANYIRGLLNGKYQVWSDNGKPQITGAFKNNLRDGNWKIYKEDGTIRYEMNYVSGVADNHQMEIDASHLIDSLEMNKGKIADPEKSGGFR